MKYIVNTIVPRRGGILVQWRHDKQDCSLLRKTSLSMDIGEKTPQAFL